MSHSRVGVKGGGLSLLLNPPSVTHVDVRPIMMHIICSQVKHTLTKTCSMEGQLQPQAVAQVVGLKSHCAFGCGGATGGGKSRGGAERGRRCTHMVKHVRVTMP